MNREGPIGYLEQDVYKRIRRRKARPRELTANFSRKHLDVGNT